MYYLAGDQLEQHNLVSWDANGEPVLRPESIQDDWNMDADSLQQQLDRLRKQLVQMEEQYLHEPVSISEPFTLEG